MPLRVIGVAWQHTRGAHIEQWICHELPQQRTCRGTVAPGTMRSKVAAVRTVLRLLGVHISSNDPGISGALDGYQRLAEQVTPPLQNDHLGRPRQLLAL